MPEPELWTIEQVAEYIGASTPASARVTLRRWKVEAAAYRPLAGGGLRAVYRADDVRAAAARRPGRGARSDLFPVLALLGSIWHRARWNADQATITTACGRNEKPAATELTMPLGVPCDMCASCTRRAMQKEE